MQDEDTGHYRCYVPKKFQSEAMEIIRMANIIIMDYERQGFSLTLRQLYYQFVSKGFLPNNQKQYDRLGSIISDARLAGLVSWTAIEDRTRNLRGTNTYETPADAVKEARAAYATDLWAGQYFRPEVWIEKDALIGVISKVCADNRVNFFGCRGYNSQSEQWRAGQRFANYINKGQRPVVLHLGDHDPSGIDMTRDNQERLSMFAGVPVTVQRLALNWDQVEQYNPPPNPAKMSDSRAADYVDKFGESSWELDALEPSVIARLIETAIAQYRDPAKWSAALAAEAEDKNTLDLIIEGL